MNGLREYVGNYMALRAEVEAHKKQGAARKKRMREMELAIMKAMRDNGWRILQLDNADALEMQVDQPYRHKTDDELAQELLAMMRKRDQVERVMEVVTTKVPSEKPKPTLRYVPPQTTHAVMLLANVQ